MPVSTPLAVHRYVTCFPREKGSLRNYQYNDNKLACYGQQGTDQPFLVQQGRKFTYFLAYWNGHPWDPHTRLYNR